MFYWIKLYTEILSDRKMMQMDDFTFRVTIMLFLLAGKENKDGELPPLSDICYELRQPMSQIVSVIQSLINLGIVDDNDGIYVVRNFAARQARPLTAYERVKKCRDKKKNNIDNDNVSLSDDNDLITENSVSLSISSSNSLSDSLSDSEIKKKKRKKDTAIRKVYGYFENVRLTDVEMNKLQKEFPDNYMDWIDKLSCYMKSTGKNYRDHLATIRNWNLRDNKKEEPVKVTHGFVDVMSIPDSELK